MNNKMILAIAYVGVLAGSAAAADQAFQKTLLADPKGTRTPVGLVFSDSKGAVEVSAGGRELVAVPYGSIDRISYEYTQKHRITQGAVVMVASVGAGAVVMLTKSRKHFLTVQYHDGATAEELVLQVDKSEYRDILAAAQMHTGQNVWAKQAVR